MSIKSSISFLKSQNWVEGENLISVMPQKRNINLHNQHVGMINYGKINKFKVSVIDNEILGGDKRKNEYY